MDEEARVLESLFHDLKHVVFGSSYPLQVSSMINRLLSRPANVEGKLEGKQPRVLDVGCGSLGEFLSELPPGEDEGIRKKLIFAFLSRLLILSCLDD